MIKDPKKFVEEEKQAREEYLRNLSVEESVRLLEELLTSGLSEQFTFEDHQPQALALMIKEAREKARKSNLILVVRRQLRAVEKRRMRECRT